MDKLYRKLTRRFPQLESRYAGIAVFVAVAVIGTFLLASSHAASPYASTEAEGGMLSGGACVGNDNNASNGSFVNFGGASCGVATPIPVCNLAAQYLTSPWTYHALSSGSQTYTVAQYQALSGYGTTLPPLPSYISGQASTTVAAVIFAPGSSTDVPQYNFPASPIIYFFEGGAYGPIGFQAISGDEFIGGSATGFPEPTFNDGGAADGISAQNDSHNGGSGDPALATVKTSAAQGATSFTITASSLPLVQYGRVAINGDTYTIASIAGSQSSGYTITVSGGLDSSVSAGTAVFYDGNAGNVTVSYLDIANDQHNTTGTIYTGAGWTITHNNIHDGFSTPGMGVALYGGDRGTIEYNCLSKMGDYGVNIFGTGNKFDYNEVYESNYEPDPGCGCSGGGKWWGTLNADIVGNAFVNDSPGGGVPIWLDNGNTGTLIANNLFDKSYGTAVESETGFNLDITGNTFQNGGWGSGNGGCGNNCDGSINLNSSGGFNIPGSRYENEILINNNQFINNWEGISAWQSGARSCENSGEGAPDAAYCSGGFPTTASTAGGGQYYFSHMGNSTNQGSTNLAQAVSAGSTTVVTEGAMAINDQIGFGDPASTTTTSSTNVSSFTGSGTFAVASTSGFPSAGQLRVGTSAAEGGGDSLSYTGAILSYTGISGNSFTGVNLVRGSGTLGGLVLQVQPYKVTSETCYANDCALTVSPAVTTSVAAGTALSNAGTCQLFATSVATPTNPLAPGGVSYWDGCQWETQRFSVTNNTFTFNPTTIATSAPLVGGGTTTSCTAAHANSCGTNFMSFQVAGEAPFASGIGLNAMMSSSSFTSCPAWDTGCTASPLKNINSLSNPPNAPANNGEAPGNNVWSNNTYTGPWLWNVYYYGTCGALPSDPATGKGMPSGACAVDFAHWQSDWQQDTSSTSN